MKRRDWMRWGAAWLAGSGTGLGMAQSAAPAATADRWAEGEVRRIDTAARKITLRHGDIPDLDMPPMTMVFQVRDPALLQGLQPGARVRFRAQKADGAYLVTDIKATP